MYVKPVAEFVQAVVVQQTVSAACSQSVLVAALSLFIPDAAC
jgi:hypothetical protein